MIVKQKTLEDKRYFRCLEDGTREEVDRDVTGEIDLDTQQAAFVNATGVQIISTSAPGMNRYWANKEQTLECNWMAVILLYRPG